MQQSDKEEDENEASPAQKTRFFTKRREFISGVCIRCVNFKVSVKLGQKTWDKSRQWRKAPLQLRQVFQIGVSAFYRFEIGEVLVLMSKGLPFISFGWWLLFSIVPWESLSLDANRLRFTI